MSCNRFLDIRYKGYRYKDLSKPIEMIFNFFTITDDDDDSRRTIFISGTETT